MASHRYLGAASDVRFFNQAKQALGEVSEVLVDWDDLLDSYEQETLGERDRPDRVVPSLPEKVSCRPTHRYLFCDDPRRVPLRLQASVPGSVSTHLAGRIPRSLPELVVALPVL